MLAFSTCWNSARHTDGAAMLREIRELGFEHVELGHGTRISLVEGILQAVESGVVRICSVHNYCPLPPGVFDAEPNLYLFSSRDELEWESAVRHTRDTIKFAARLGAQTVVLHAGVVPTRRWMRKLIQLSETGKRDTPKYGRVLEKALAQRTRHQPRLFAQTIKCFHAIVSFAAEHKVSLGIETRYSLEEIPDENELEEMLRLFPGETVGYWHDFGHAQVRANLGVGLNDGWLDRFSSRLIGFHVHDTIGYAGDHQAPGDGKVDFQRLAGYARGDVPCVLELSPGVPPDRVRAGLEHIQIICRSEPGTGAATK
jgi:sugar phosphate isomerase/epimerase